MDRERKSEFSFKICEHIGTIATNGSGWTKELNLVSWNGADPKYDIRDWDRDHTHMGRGLTFKKEEMKALVGLALDYGIGPESEGIADEGMLTAE